MESRFRISLTAQIGIGLLLGILAGVAVGPSTVWLGDIGKLVIQAIKVAATPLLLLAIINAVLTADVSAKSGLRMVVLATINATIALGIGLLFSNLLQPGRHLSSIAEPAGPAITAQK